MKLAASSAETASRVRSGMEKAQASVRQVLSKDINEETARDLAGAARLVEAVQTLQARRAEAHQVLRQQVADAKGINQSLAGQIGEMLGSIQYQDIVRQIIDRHQQAQADKDRVFASMARDLEVKERMIEFGGQSIKTILDEFVERESSHVSSAPSPGSAPALKVELF
jgi:methyl-accepting chemotaxis protein